MKKKKDDLTKAREFFETIIRVFGENQLYRTMFGELPVDDETEAKIRKLQKMEVGARPLKDIINKFITEK